MTVVKRTGMAALAALFILAALAGGCEKTKQVIAQGIKPPAVAVRDYTIDEISTKHLTVVLHLVIDNPNPIGLKLTSVTYELTLAEKPLISGSTENGADIKAGGTCEVDVSVVMNYADVLAVYDAVQAVDEVPYQIKGRITLDTPIGPLPIPYKSEGMMPVVRPPKVADLGIQLGNVSFSGMDAVIKMTLENPNGFPLDIRFINYQLFLENKPFSTGSVIGKPIPAHGTATMDAPVNVAFGSAGSWIYSLVLKGQAAYLLQLDAGYTMKGKPVKQSEQWNGTLKFWK